MSEPLEPLLCRDHQRALLEAGQSAYPNTIKVAKLAELRERHPAHAFNLAYLMEHGLMLGQVALSDDGASFSNVRITVRGIDFLEDDGGLSAILRLTTIRLEHDELRALLLEHFTRHEQPSPSGIAQFARELQQLPAAATRQLALELLKRGLDQWPAALQCIRSILA